MKIDIILVTKFDVIRVVFQDQMMYAHTLFRGAKHAKLGERVCFDHVYKYWLDHDEQSRKK